jgi:hypothetical protein
VDGDQGINLAAQAREVTMQTITIELRVDFDTRTKKDREKIMLDIATESARQIFCQAQMLCDTPREPQIRLECGDFVSETQEIRLLGDGS